MSEFSEPEDLMEGIHVAVSEDVTSGTGATGEGGVAEGAAGETSSLLPHLTVENGHVHQEHVRHWSVVGDLFIGAYVYTTT